MRVVSFPCESKKQTSTLVAFAENSAKLTPFPSHVAPRGYGSPSFTAIGNHPGNQGQGAIGAAGPPGLLAGRCLIPRIPLYDPFVQKKILVVDDNVDAADTLTLLLRNEGHDVHTAYGGRGGIPIADDLRPD